jgi:hypothetical protein
VKPADGTRPGGHAFWMGRPIAPDPRRNSENSWVRPQTTFAPSSRDVVMIMRSPSFISWTTPPGVSSRLPVEVEVRVQALRHQGQWGPWYGAG